MTPDALLGPPPDCTETDPDDAPAAPPDEIWLTSVKDVLVKQAA